MLCPKRKPLRDKLYRKRAKRMPCRKPGCLAHGENGDVVLAHIATVNNSGMGMKPGDDESFYLCSKHHAEMDQFPGLRAEWIVMEIVIPEEQGRYQRWKMSTGG